MFKFAVRKTEEICAPAARAQRPRRRPTSICSSRTRPTAASSSRRPRSSASTRARSIINIERFGNTTAATIPLALNDAVCSGPAEEGRSRAARVGRRRLHRRRGAAALGVLKIASARIARFCGCSRAVAASSCSRRPTAAARRAKQALSPNARRSRWRRQLRSPDGAPLGDLFAFVSGLYFRGKLTYARRFARPPEPDNPIVGGGVHVITPNAGLRSPDTPVTARARCARSPTATSIADNAALPPSARSERARAARARSAPTATSCCSAASRRRSTSTCCRRSSASGCCFRSTSSAAAT